MKDREPIATEDLWLRELLDDEPLPDAGFTARFANRLSEQERLRRRRFTLAAVAASVGLLGLLAWIASSIRPVDPGVMSTLWSPLALLLGLGLIGLLWLDTEPLRFRLPDLSATLRGL